MFASMQPQGAHITYQHNTPIIGKFTVEHTVHTRSSDTESLLVDFLSDCLYLSDVHNEAYFDATFKLLTNTELEAHIYGVSITGFGQSEVKAVTYHDLKIEQTDQIWQATLVFDM
jgi:SHS2 domain-containing protein